MSYSAVLFDLDGTLVDSLPDITRSVNAMLEQLDVTPIPHEQVALFVGKGIRHLVNEVLAFVDYTGDTEHAFTLFDQHYTWQSAHSIAQLFDGVIDGLEALQAAGLKLAVVTNKPSRHTPPLLEQMGISHYFELIVGGDTCAERKPHPMPFLHACKELGIAPSQAIVIGDSSNDSIAARAASIDVLLVPYGYSGGKSVQTLDCDGIVSSISDAAQQIIQQ